MPKIAYRTEHETKPIPAAQDVVQDIPKQYQLRTINVVLAFRLVVANAADTIKAGGLFGMLERIELLRSGSNQLFSTDGIKAAAWAAVKRRINPAQFITIWDTVNNQFLTDAQKDEIPVGTYDVSITIPIDFANFGGIRPSDTLYNSDTRGDTFQIQTRRKANASVFETPANITITSPQITLVLDQVRSIRQGEALIPVVGQFLRGEVREDLKVASAEREVFLPTSPTYMGALLGIFNPVDRTPDEVFYAHVKRVRTAIQQDVYLNIDTRQYRNESEVLFGDFYNWKWADRFMPILFPRQPAKTADRLSDAWLTQGYQDTKFKLDHDAVDGKEIHVLYEQFLPYDADWVNNLVTRARG